MSAETDLAPIEYTVADPEFYTWMRVTISDLGVAATLRIEGWLFFYAGEIQHVRAVVGDKTWDGQYGLPRPDLTEIFPAIPQAAFSGFSIAVPALAATSFELKIEAQNPAGKFKTIFSQEISIPPDAEGKVASPPQPIVSRYEGLQRGYVCWIDQPHDWQKLSRRFHVSGWCFAKNGVKIEAIRARVGTREFPGNFGLFRPDVAASCGDREVTFKSGFDVAVELPRTRSILKLEALQGREQWNEIFSRTVRAPLISFGAEKDESISAVGDYESWIKHYDTLSWSERRKIRAHINVFPRQPLISILMPVYNPTASHLRDALQSVRKQLYPHWQLCLVDDASTTKHVRPILSRYARMDQRITVKFRAENGGIAAASNDALTLARGDWVALMDDDDELASTALYFVAHEINQHPRARLIYSDEDKLDTTGRRTNPHFKSDWNWQLLLAQNYCSHLNVFKTELIKEVGFREGFEGSQDYDLILRCSEKIEPDQIRHIPRILYHWRMSEQSAALNLHAKPQARTAAIRAVQEHLARRGIAATVARSGLGDFQRIQYELPDEKPRVSIVIPTRDCAEMLRTCVQSLLEKTTYPAFDILLIDNGSTDPAALSYLEELAAAPRLRVLRQPGEFNYGRLNNFGVRNTDSEFVALLNNDLTVITPAWLEEMVGQGLQSSVGAVGARLLFPDNTIQHAGVILGAGGGGVADHAHKRLPRDNYGYFARGLLAQELSAVTAACMLVKRSTYLEIGGFEEQHLKVAFNDVDFCLRLAKHGYRIVYTPYAEFYHHESASRGLEDNVSKHLRFSAEVEYIKSKWGKELATDRYYNPNLSLSSGQLFTLAFPPRTQKPWQKTR